MVMPTAIETRRDASLTTTASTLTLNPGEVTVLTRSEVIEQARALGAPITERNLRHWEAAGVIPRPVRRRYRGATRATYPPETLKAILKAFELRRQGASIPEVRSQTRTVPATAAISVEGSAQGATALGRIEEITALAHRHTQVTKTTIARAVIHLIDQTGTPVATFTVPIDTTPKSV
jgi:DNA-binding transcriptional MerR regulator